MPNIGKSIYYSITKLRMTGSVCVRVLKERWKKNSEWSMFNITQYMKMSGQNDGSCEIAKCFRFTFFYLSNRSDFDERSDRRRDQKQQQRNNTFGHLSASICNLVVRKNTNQIDIPCMQYGHTFHVIIMGSRKTFIFGMSTSLFVVFFSLPHFVLCVLFNEKIMWVFHISVFFSQ